MKLLKRFISWTIWSIIALNLILTGLTHLSASQQYLGKWFSNAISQKLGTEVTIGRVSPGLLNRLIIDDVVLLDQQKQELLRAARLSVKIDLLPLTKGKVSISSAQLFGTQVKIYRQNAETAYNFQFIVDSLASRDTTKHTPLDLRINSLIIRHSSINYDQLDQPTTEGHFNPSHIRLRNISAHINLKTLTDDSLNINVKRLGFSELSGLDVSRLTFRLEAGHQHALLHQFQLLMPSSNIQIDTLSAAYQTDDMHIISGSLAYQGNINNAYITPSDLRCFEPSLKNYQRKIDIQALFNGTDTQLTVQHLKLSSIENDIIIQASGWFENWQKHPAWHLQMNNLTLSDNSIDFLVKNFRQVPRELSRIGHLQMNGTFDRTLQGETSLKSQIQAGIGNLDVQFNIAQNQSFEGHINTDKLNLRQLFANDQFGIISTQVSLNGQLHNQQKPDLTVRGLVDKLEYNDYTYSNIHLDGQYHQGTVSGNFTIDDPNFVAQLQGELEEQFFDKTTTGTHQVLLKGSINRLSPATVKLTNQIGTAELSADIDADFKGTTLNDLQGNVRISNLFVSATENSQPYRLDNLIVSSGYYDGVHFVSLKSDFADAELKGQFDYNTLAQSLVNAVGSQLPTLPGLPPISNQTANNFSLRLLLSKTDWLRRFFNIDLTLQQPISLQARINDQTQDIYLDGDFPSFTYQGGWYSDGAIHITTPADTIKCDLKVNKLMDNGHHLNIGVLAKAHQNRIASSFTWDNHHDEARMSGELNSIVQLYRNLNNKQEAHIRMMPSHVILNNGTWEVEPSDILYAENHLLVDHFAVHRGQQHIIVDGIASKRTEDHLTVDLNEVEVAYILDLVNFHSVEFSGKATGKADITSLFSDFTAYADLQVDDFLFEKGRMGVLHAKANWNKELQQIDIKAVADDGKEAQTYINGYVSPVHNTIDLDIQADGTYIDFMHNFTRSFLSDITGHAQGNARLSGTLDNINLTGELVVNGKATVTPLNTTYQLLNDTVVMVPDEIELRRMPVYDKYGNQAILSGGIHHRHLTRLTYDLDVEAENLLAYDFHEFGESTFYGTVYATGNVSIQGRPNEVTINCDVTPEKNSVFVYNAANPDAITKQEFIEWVSPEASGQTASSGSTSAPRSSRATDTDIYINFLINATPDATLRLLMDASTNDYISLNGDGAIRATFHNKGPFNMFGTYTVDHGTYGITIQNIIKKNFTFNRGGTIVFGGDPYNAALNLQAVYTVNGVSLSDLNIGNSFTNNTIRVNCLMNIGGQPVAPQVDFDLEMPTVNADEQQMVRSVINGQQEMNQQVVYLLGIGRFYNQGANNSASNERSDQTSLAMQSFLSGTLSTQINSLLNQFIKNDNWNFGANISTGNEGWHNAEYEGIINGRILNNRLLLNGQFGYRDNATQANPSFIGDFDVQYLLYPNGNLALKVYNQTNDRYFTKSSLNTQGIGVIMKKDFNGLRDLFSTKKKKKKSTASQIQEYHAK